MVSEPDERGWRVGHVGRHAVSYEQLDRGAWRLEFGGEASAEVTGDGGYVIYFGSRDAWNKRVCIMHSQRTNGS